MTKTEPLRINGWLIVAHELFLDQVATLIADVMRDRTRHPDTYKSRRAAKMLAAVVRLAFRDIPSDPASTAYQQGGTLGDQHRHWRRAKFYQQYRLFFRYRATDGGEKVIAFAWVNDDSTRRAYGSKTDAYAVFRRMLDGGNPPNDWADLMAKCRCGDIRQVMAEAEALLGT